MNPPQGLVFALAHHAANGLGIALIIALHVGKDADARLESAAFLLQAAQAFGLAGQHTLTAVQFHPAALSDVLGRCPFLLKGRLLVFNILQALHAAGNLGLYFADPAALLFQILENTPGVFDAALDIGVQDGRLRIAGRKACFCRRKAFTGLLGLDVLLVHTLAQAVAGDVNRLKLGLAVFQFGGELFILLPDRFGLGAELVQCRKPDGDFLFTQLIAQQQIALCHLGLFAQRPDLELELLNLIVDAQQVFFGFFKLAFGLFLAPAVTRNAGGLFKNLAAVGAARRDDVGNPALADDGIAVPAEARIQKETDDILEPDGFLIDKILTLAAAVIAAGEHQLASLDGENLSGVVEDQGDLCKAHGRADLGPAEDDILHLAAAQGLGALFAHDPENGIGDVGLARAVRPDDGRDILFKCQARLVREGLEALDFQSL